jgi:predicted nucleic acid-binding protein
MIRIYLDNCCFNRPFDDQSSIRVKLETDAKLYIQLMVRTGKLELAWSYIIDFENNANPFDERKNTIENWRSMAVVDILENDRILSKAIQFVNGGLKPKDALHIACAIESGCSCFLTTDDLILKKMANQNEIAVLNPVDFAKQINEK